MRNRWPKQPERALTDMAVVETFYSDVFGPVHIGGTTSENRTWAAWGDKVRTVRIRSHDSYQGHVVHQIPNQLAPPGLRVQLDGTDYSIDKKLLWSLLPHRRGQCIHVELEGRRYVYRAYAGGRVIEREGHGLVLSAPDRKADTKGLLARHVDALDASLALVIDRAVSPSELTFF